MARMNVRAALLLAVGVLLCAGPPALRADGVTVALYPTAQTVTPGAEFDLYVQCTVAGAPFNAFDTIVGWNPAALTNIPLSPVSQQVGSYMTGACGTTFHIFLRGASSDTITDVLLCDGVSLTGPGQLYRLRFRASSTPQQTSVQFQSVQFYNAGMYVNPVHTTNAAIGIGMPPTGVGDPLVPGLTLDAAPNPSRGPLALALGADRPGLQLLTVRDVQGRLVCRLDGGWFPAGPRIVAWDGRDNGGIRVPAGIYFVTLELAGRYTSKRVTLLP